MIELESLGKKARELIFETAEMIRTERENFEIEVKGQSDFVTSIDKMSEEKLVAGLSELLPGSGFIAEEETSKKVGEVYNWVIDPIDGTTNFIHGVAPHAISVALMRNKTIVMGIVYEIVHGEMFYAHENSPAFLNDLEIKVSDNHTHQQALVVTGFPYTNFKKIDEYFDAMRELMEETSGIRRLGSAATDLCYIACGRYDAFWEYGLHVWDVAAGAFIVQQAGGKACDFDGTDDFINNGNIIATNAKYFDKFYEIVNRHLGENE
ncbi:MAG: inositol monophosphatase family protein [Prolixibacteraceae bacterium]|jgi:myo-inositol-1(or 4)-monophosphatase|nr:inositol monophosphatase family protein [Prolixibacteraceae bacterium]